MSARTSLSSIPTLSHLFKNGQLKAAGSSASLPSYSKLLDQVSLFQGDITSLEIDAIVNAANESLLGGGGVDGAIHRAAGSELLKECRTLKGAKTGEAKMTKGYNLPAKHVIHTVGPIYSKSNAAESQEKLKSAYQNSLTVASKAGLKSVAFPSISTGVYGYPMKDATNVAIQTVGQYLETMEGKELERVIFCVFSKKDYDFFKRGLDSRREDYRTEDAETEERSE